MQVPMQTKRVQRRAKTAQQEHIRETNEAPVVKIVKKMDTFQTKKARRVKNPRTSYRVIAKQLLSTSTILASVPRSGDVNRVLLERTVNRQRWRPIYCHLLDIGEYLFNG